MKNLVSSYTRVVWVVYSGAVRGGVGTGIILKMANEKGRNM